MSPRGGFCPELGPATRSTSARIGVLKLSTVSVRANPLRLAESRSVGLCTEAGRFTANVKLDSLVPMREKAVVSGAVRAAMILAALAVVLRTKAADWPGKDWPTATPESQDLSSTRLDAIKERLAAKKTRAFLVVRNDRIVYEWYAPGVTATTKQGTASLAKALVGGMSLAVAITDGKISIDDPAARFVPQWRHDPRKSGITIRHLGSHTSGLSDSTTENVKHEEQPGWMGDFWKRLDPPRDPFTLARDETPMLCAPGEKLQYSNPGIGMMAYCVTAAIRDGEHKDVRTLLRDRVMVRNGETLTPGPGEPPVRTNDVLTLYHDYRARILFEPLVEALTNSPRSSRHEEAQFEKPEPRNPNSKIDRSFLTSAASNAV